MRGVSAVVSSLSPGRKTALMLELCKLLRDELSIGAVSTLLRASPFISSHLLLLACAVRGLRIRRSYCAPPFDDAAVA